MAADVAPPRPGSRDLGVADLGPCLALSAAAGWNQNADDWRLMLALGRCRGIEGPDGRLIASALVLPFEAPIERPFAWISMVLVLPDCRGRGLATELVDEAIRQLAAESRVAVLDATPAGFPVYRRLGFEPAWGFARYRREAGAGAGRSVPAPPPGIRIRPMSEADSPAVRALDRPAFGADRGDLLDALVERLPAAARVAERDGVLVGYVCGRDGREARQLGPLLAADDATAGALLGAALAAVDAADLDAAEVNAAEPGSAEPGSAAPDSPAGAGRRPVYVDLADRWQTLLPWLEGQGFRRQRPFTRMVLGAGAAPGDARPLVLMAGPELG